ncbi:MAG: transglutaminase-like domain-containing protein [Desulfobacca sp.]|nr:transglutaminase-like domain-containing protein [Desulfobacca sp.]
MTPTDIIDSDHPLVQEYAQGAAKGATDPVEIAKGLYLAVRDGIRYDFYAPFHLPQHYQASQVIKRGRQFCVPKASLLCALARVYAIPSRLGFANLKNHLATTQLLEYLGTNILVYHAFAELYLDGRWVKATPAFNRELCQRHGVSPLEFNGREDSLFQLYNEKNQRYMEYLEFLGTYADVPVSEIVAAFRQTYGEERVDYWIRMSEERGEGSISTFDL